jgi:lipopolysaccharide export system protein LptA
VQRHRTLDGSDMVIAYGAQNRIESFRARNIKTLTDPTPEERKHNRPQAVTSSKDILARFDPGTSKMSSLDQSGEFHYDEGDRHARAAKATLDQGSNVMVLETGARVWDSTGSTTGDRIRMDQTSGNFTAEGNVRSSRLADPDQKSRPGMLSGDEPLEAQADRMDSADRNRRIHYEGRVSLWQGANRLQAGVVDVDRQKQTVVADKDVVSNLWQQPKPEADSVSGEKPSAPVLILVRAPHMVYADQNRLAEYSGGVRLDRPGMQVKSKLLRAYLADSSADSRLEKAFAEGAVEIVQKNGDLTRNATSEHAEYYPDSQKVFLSGGMPHLIETLKGQLKGETHGCELTYFGNDDRLLVNGCSEQPVKSRIRRK